jgi:L-asparaginase
VTSFEDGSRDGVLVIAAGGNIGLYASEVKHEWVVRPAKVKELEELVLGSSSGPAHGESGRLVLREGSVKGASVRVTFESIRPPGINSVHEPEDLDSAQVDPVLWRQIAERIKEAYSSYEGFVILHGLDTMAYTAAALSFMLENLAGPVVLTGAQRPLNFGRTDAIQNIITAITFAASRSLGLTPVIPEVCVYSHDALFRGNRVMMASSSSYRAFDSPNYPAVANVGEHVEVQHHLIRPASTVHRLSVKPQADARVAIVDVFPGMDARVLTTLANSHAQNSDRPLRGVLLRTYGMGTAPTSDDEFLTALRTLVDNGVVVLNVTQARSGRISHNIDPVSLRLLEQGVVSGIDMTAEAAYAKMVVVLSGEADAGRAADLLQIEHCGEQSQSIFHWHFNADKTVEEEGAFFAPLRALEAMVNFHQLDENLVTYAQLRLLGVEPADSEKKVVRTIEFKATLQDKRETRQAPLATLAEDTLRWRPDGKRTLNRAYDITPRKGMVCQSGLLLELETSEAIRWSRLAIALYCKPVGNGG